MINYSKILFFLVIPISLFSQTKEETLDYINIKQNVYEHKNGNGDFFKYKVFLEDTIGLTLLVVSETAALSGDIYKEDYFTVDIKDITAIEYALDEINRKQIKIFAKNRGITKLNTHFNETSIETVLEMTFSKNTEPEQIKSLIKSWKHLIKICGGKDLSKDQF